MLRRIRRRDHDDGLPAQRSPGRVLFLHGRDARPARDPHRAGGTESKQSRSRRRKRERGVWQRRFWEHQIRDERDLQRHVDYIHYNPVKHGLVENVEDWPWSSYHRWVREMPYPQPDWQTAQRDLTDLDIYE